MKEFRGQELLIERSWRQLSIESRELLLMHSRSASGIRIVNGPLAGPVAELTIAGNLLEMFKALTPADDLEWHRVVNVPTLRVDGMVVAGD